MVEVGQKYRVLPAFVGCENNRFKPKTQVGTVVYIHPKGRYAVLKFDGVYGEPREGFNMADLTQQRMVLGKKGK